MSYRCELCGDVVPSGVSLIRKVVETRAVEYKDAEGRVIGAGTEVVKELQLCPKCVALQSETPTPNQKYIRKAAPSKPVKVEKFTTEEEGKPSRRLRRNRAA